MLDNAETAALLAESLHLQARAAIADDAVVPPPRFAGAAAPVAKKLHRRPATRWVAPLAAAAAVVGVGLGVAAVQSLHGPAGDPVATGPRPSVTAPAGRSSTTVGVKLLNEDGATYGVGMPVIAYFSRRITSGRSLQQATTATVDGRSVSGAWFFERSAAGDGPVEAHYRLKNYWPPHARIDISMPIDGLSAGGKLSYGNSLTLHFTTGAQHIATVDAATHRMTVRTPHRADRTFPVSVGSVATPTRTGTKVIMEQHRLVTARTSTGRRLPLEYAQRLTYGGEFLTGAPWNVKAIEDHLNTTAGSTTLLPADAATLYHLLRIGDVVRYTPSAGGTPMQVGSGYGDWNETWTTWLRGGLVPTH